MPHLQYTGAGGSVQRFAITRKLSTIGASADCHLVIDGVDVAETHATLTREPGRFRLDAASRKAPLFINGKKSKGVDLKHGDLVVIGGVELVFSSIDSPESVGRIDEADDALEIQAMRRLLEFSRLLDEPGDLDGLLDELTDQIVGLTGAKKGFLVLAFGDEYVIKTARNLDRQPVDDPQQLLSDEIIHSVITSKRPQIISDAMHDTRFQNSMSVINLELSSVMCAPLLARGELLGLIYVGNDDVVNLFTEPQLEMLEVFASQAALFIKTAQFMNELRDESSELAQRIENIRFGSLVGACPAMIEVYKRVDKVAAADITVLITGETGTGKELIARELHERSDRADGPFVPINCGAIPANLIESELFGHRKGAFTGAVANQMGKFEAAENGTLFLDEIGELPLPMQVKLLRVLQERRIQPVGQTDSIPVNARIVAATNRNLEDEVRESRFREDLYFRLDVIKIDLPPLRARGDDVLLIARYFVARFAKEFGRDFDAATCLSEATQRLLFRFEWPGNIRQLENHIKKAIVLAEGPQIQPDDLELQLPEGETPDGGPMTLSEARDRWQRQYINRILAINNGNRSKTARDLDVDPRTIFRHLTKEKERDGKGDS